MNAIVPVGGSSLVPQDMDQAIRFAKAMSSAGVVPDHLKGDVGSCLMIIEQAMRWRMSPFAVAQCTSSIHGKLMFEGKLVAAAVESSGAIVGGFDYKFSGRGDERKIIVSATRVGESEPRELEIELKAVRTSNQWWGKQPDQQLVYAGTRAWARRWTPAVILGVYAPEEFDRATGQVVADGNVDLVIDVDPEKTSAPAVTDETQPDRLDSLESAMAAAANIEVLTPQEEDANQVVAAQPQQQQPQSQPTPDHSDQQRKQKGCQEGPKPDPKELSARRFLESAKGYISAAKADVDLAVALSNRAVAGPLKRLMDDWGDIYQELVKWCATTDGVFAKFGKESRAASNVFYQDITYAREAAQARQEVAQEAA